MKRRSFLILVIMYILPLGTSSFASTFSTSKTTKEMYFESSTGLTLNLKQISSLSYQLPQNICCDGTYKFEIPGDSFTNQQSLYIYFPAIGAKKIEIDVNGNTVFESQIDMSSAGLILSLDHQQFNHKKLSFEVFIESAPSLFSGFWKGPPIIDTLDNLVERQKTDQFLQSTLPLFLAICCLLLGLVFTAIHFRSQKSSNIYALFAYTLITWGIFYIYLGGVVREINFNFGSNTHFLARSFAWGGTYALILSYINFVKSPTLLSQTLLIKIGVSLTILQIVVQTILGIMTAAVTQVVFFSVLSPFAFLPLFAWSFKKREDHSFFSWFAYGAAWLAFFGQLLDSSALLERALLLANSLPQANRFTFPFLLAATALIYIRHFSGFLEQLRKHITRLKKINRSALILIQSNFDHSHVQEFVKSLRLAMRARRCTLAELQDDGSFKVVGASGLPDDAFGSPIRVNENPSIQQAILNKTPTIGECTQAKYSSYTSTSFMTTPVFINDRIQYLILLSDPITDPSFTTEDLPYMKQFSLMMGVQRYRQQAEEKFRKLIGSLDKSLYEYVMNRQNKTKDSIKNDTSWRAIGYFDQSGFLKSFSKIPEKRQHEFVEAIKLWAASSVHRYGGKIRSFGGDAYLFDITPFPQESQNSVAERLANTLIDLAEKLPTLNQQLLSKGFGAVTFRYGGHVGLVTDVSLLDLGANITTIIGQSVNLTQRIQAVAQAGNILISQELAQLLGENFVTRQTSMDQLKDFSVSSSLYSLEGRVENAAQAVGE